MHEYNILMHENEISMHENENFIPCGIFAPEIFMGNWAVHYFMHGILIHENLWVKSSFSCTEI